MAKKFTWDDPTNGRANIVEVLYTDGINDPDTLYGSVNVGVQELAVADEELDLPEGRRFASRGVNTDTDPDTPGPLSNIHIVPSDDMSPTVHVESFTMSGLFMEHDLTQAVDASRTIMFISHSAFSSTESRNNLQCELSNDKITLTRQSDFVESFPAVTAYLVEFPEGGGVNVQHGVVTMTESVGASTEPVAINETTPGRRFLLYTKQLVDPQARIVLGRFTATDELESRSPRDQDGGTIIAYQVVSLPEAASVQEIFLQHTNNGPDFSHTLATAVDRSKSFVLSSIVTHNTSASTSAKQYCNAWISEDGTKVEWTSSASGNPDQEISLFVVEWGGLSVQHVPLSMADTEATASDTITEVALSRAAVVAGGSCGFHGRCTNTNSRASKAELTLAATSVGAERGNAVDLLELTAQVLEWE